MPNGSDVKSLWRRTEHDCGQKCYNLHVKGGAFGQRKLPGNKLLGMWKDRTRGVAIVTRLLATHTRFRLQSFHFKYNANSRQNPSHCIIQWRIQKGVGPVASCGDLIWAALLLQPHSVYPESTLVISHFKAAKLLHSQRDTNSKARPQGILRRCKMS